MDPVTEQHVRLLKRSDDDSIAVNAAWLEAVRLKRRPVTTVVGVIEGRLHVNVPNLWIGWLIEKSRAGDEANREFQALPKVADLADCENGRCQPLAPAYVDTNSEFYLRADTGVVLDAGRIRIETGADSDVLINPEPVLSLTKHLGGRRRVEVASSEGRVFLAGFDASDDWRFPLVCVDSGSGELLWTTKVWSNSDRPFSLQVGAVQDHYCWIDVGSAQVVVFGAGTDGTFCEAFDSASGERTFRFSTSDLHFE